MRRDSYYPYKYAKAQILCAQGSTESATELLRSTILEYPPAPFVYEFQRLLDSIHHDPQKTIHPLKGYRFIPMTPENHRRTAVSTTFKLTENYWNDPNKFATWESLAPRSSIELSGNVHVTLLA
jgi:hypothetical protein